MKQWIRLVMAVCFSMAMIGSSYAEEMAPQTSPWKGNLELSYLNTSGNTHSETFVAAGKVEHAFENSKLSLDARAIYGKKDEVTSDKSWIGTLKYDYNVTERTYAYLSETLERNTLKGITLRSTSTIGLGHYFIKTSTDSLRGELGFGYTRENQVDPSPDRGFPTARLFGGYGHAFTEKTRFEQTVEYLPDLKRGDNYLINEESSFITNLMGNLAFKISYAIFYNNLPPPGFKKEDRLFKNSLLYTF